MQTPIPGEYHPTLDTLKRYTEHDVFESFISELRLKLENQTTQNDPRSTSMLVQGATIRIPSITFPPSPVPSILGSNLVPSQWDSKSVDQFLQDIQPNIRSLDKEIGRVEGILVHLLQMRKWVHTYEHSHRALLSPFRRFPAELLSEVFIQCLPSGTFQDFPCTKDPPLLLLQVCKNWKEIALKTPRLWAKGMFRLSPFMSAAKKRGMRDWILRSGACPLSLHFGRHWASPRNQPLVFDDFLSSSPQWQSLALNMHEGDLIGLLPVKHRLPLLQVVELHLSVSEPSDLRLDMFESAPRLHHLAISGAFLPNPNNFSFPWDQLTTLIISHQDTLAVANLLQCCPRLTHFDYDTHPDPTEPVSPLPDIALNHLQTLVSYEGTWLLGKLTLPALQELELIISPNPNSSTWISPCSSLIRNSRCRITRLSLACISICSELIEFLRLTSDVQNLQLFNQGIFEALDMLVANLIFRQDQPPLLPKLRRFEVTHDAGFDPRLVIAMAESRWRIPTKYTGMQMVERIHSIRVSAHHGWPIQHSMDGEVLDRIHSLKREGLHLQLS